MDQVACMFLILIWMIKGINHDLVQHLRQKVLGSLHLPHSVHCIIDVFVVQVVCHQGLLKWQVISYSMLGQVDWAGRMSVNSEVLTVIFCSSSFVGGAFLVDFAGFSWIGGGLFFKPSCGDCTKTARWVRVCWNRQVQSVQHLFSMYNITCPSKPWALGGIIVICGCSFGTCFLLKMKDCAGLRLIWKVKDSKCFCPFPSRLHYLTLLDLYLMYNWNSTSSALSFPFLLNRGAMSFDCICPEWFCLWLKTGELCPFERWCRINITHDYRVTLQKHRTTIHMQVHVPGLVLRKACFLLQTEAGVKCYHFQHGHWRVGLSDDAP